MENNANKNTFRRTLSSIRRGSPIAAAAACVVLHIIIASANAWFPFPITYYIISAVTVVFSAALGIYARGDAKRIMQFGAINFIFTYLANFGDGAGSIDLSRMLNRILIHLANALIFTAVFALSAFITRSVMKKNVKILPEPEEYPPEENGDKIYRPYRSTSVFLTANLPVLILFAVMFFLLFISNPAKSDSFFNISHQVFGWIIFPFTTVSSIFAAYKKASIFLSAFLYSAVFYLFATVYLSSFTREGWDIAGLVYAIYIFYLTVYYIAVGLISKVFFKRVKIYGGKHEK